MNLHFLNHSIRGRVANSLPNSRALSTKRTVTVLILGELAMGWFTHHKHFKPTFCLGRDLTPDLSSKSHMPHRVPLKSTSDTVTNNPGHSQETNSLGFKFSKGVKLFQVSIGQRSIFLHLVYNNSNVLIWGFKPIIPPLNMPMVNAKVLITVTRLDQIRLESEKVSLKLHFSRDNDNFQ